MVKIVTHDGHFHIDDVFAVAALMLLYPDAEIIRTRDEEKIAEADMVVDVGAKYSPEEKFFDHHQPEGAGKRENGIPYAAFGLVWKEYGETLSGSKEVAELIDNILVASIDATDNGFKLSVPMIEGVKEYGIEDYLDLYIYGVETEDEMNKRFKTALNFAQDVLKKEIETNNKKVHEWREVKKIYENSEDKKIIFLPKHLSWKQILIPTEAIYVVADRLDGKWQAMAVPKHPKSYELKKPFPSSWAGKTGENLAEISGVKDATFCHRNLFLAVAKTKEGAVQLAQKALEN